MIPFYSFSLILLIFLFLPSLSSISNISTPFMNPTSMPTKRNFSSFSLSSNQPLSNSIMGNSNFNPNNNPRKLRRLPHVFSKVLELPFNSDFDVDVKEHHDCFKFVADVVENAEIVSNGVRAHVVKVHPGITKVVIRRKDNNNNSNNDDPILQNIDELQLDLWRFRLPGSARPELATAVYARGQLVVTVPKNGLDENNTRGGGDCKGGGFKGNFECPVLVQ